MIKMKEFALTNPELIFGGKLDITTCDSERDSVV